jgi:hypothetical protein
MRKILVLVLCFGVFGCHKKPSVPSTPMVTPVQNPERLIFRAEISVPREHRAKIKKTDILLCDLNDGMGKNIAHRIIPVPKFPYDFKVTARDMVRAIPESSVLLFSARIVHFGEEHELPKKGQLSAMVGTVPAKETVVNQHVDQRRLQKWAKKNDIVDDAVLSVGANTKAKLIPSPW